MDVASSLFGRQIAELSNAIRRNRKKLFGNVIVETKSHKKMLGKVFFGICLDPNMSKWKDAKKICEQKGYEVFSASDFFPEFNELDELPEMKAFEEKIETEISGCKCFIQFLFDVQSAKADAAKKYCVREYELAKDKLPAKNTWRFETFPKEPAMSDSCPEKQDEYFEHMSPSDLEEEFFNYDAFLNLPEKLNNKFASLEASYIPIGASANCSNIGLSQMSRNTACIETSELWFWMIGNGRTSDMRPVIKEEGKFYFHGKEAIFRFKSDRWYWVKKENDEYHLYNLNQNTESSDEHVEDSGNRSRQLIFSCHRNEGVSLESCEDFESL